MKWETDLSRGLPPWHLSGKRCSLCYSLCSRHAPAIPYPLSIPLSLNDEKVLYSPAENFSLPLFIFKHDGGKSCPLTGWGHTAHACFHGEWFTDVYQEWIDQRRPHDRRSIKHQIKDGNPHLTRRALWKSDAQATVECEVQCTTWGKKKSSAAWNYK